MSKELQSPVLVKIGVLPYTAWFTFCSKMINIFLEALTFTSSPEQLPTNEIVKNVIIQVHSIESYQTKSGGLKKL